MGKVTKYAAACMAMFSIIGAFIGCSQQSDGYANSPIDKIVRDMNSEPNFSIILYDMDYKQNAMSSDVYRHKYQIITPKGEEVTAKDTDWLEVPQAYFDSQVNNMGMEVVSKVDGKLNKVATPAGYSQYVGNSQYGQWTNRGGSSFWEFYGRYAMMSTMFNMMSPVPRGYYDDYSRSDRNRPYYGSPSTGGNVHGTASTMNKRGGSSSWSKSQSNFKSSVQSRVRRSSSLSSSAGRSSSRSSTGRSSSSSYRSRGGGFGK